MSLVIWTKEASPAFDCYSAIFGVVGFVIANFGTGGAFRMTLATIFTSFT